MDWANSKGISLDFNPTYFAHPLAEDGMTLSHASRSVRDFWIEHGKACRNIAAAIAAHQDDPCILNHWIPDGRKDSPADRWKPRERLVESLDAILSNPYPGCVDSVESKLFGLGSEDYVVGSFEFYSHYALLRKVLLCLDMGHFHPTETIADKLSALLQFHESLLLHVSRPIRWDSDHVVLFNDDLRAVFQELARGNALPRVRIALDYFDASINRVSAYCIGIRATRKAILYALLEPIDKYQQLEASGHLDAKLAWMEEAKTLPFGAVWDELCVRAETPGLTWIEEARAYEDRVLSKR
jgi:L-rhamnose isomerase